MHVEAVLQIALFQIGQNQCAPGKARGPVGVAVGKTDAVDRSRLHRIADIGGRKITLSVVELVNRDAKLMQIIDAMRPPCGLAGRLHGRQQQRDQHADDRDHDQQLD